MQMWVIAPLNANFFPLLFNGRLVLIGIQFRFLSRSFLGSEICVGFRPFLFFLRPKNNSPGELNYPAFGQ